MQDSTTAGGSNSGGEVSSTKTMMLRHKSSLTRRLTQLPIFHVPPVELDVKYLFLPGEADGDLPASYCDIFQMFEI
jgi:hypothetical protein